MFDRSFAKSMVKDNQDDIKEYQKESSKSDAAGQLAKETLPVLRKHLEAAQSLRSRSRRNSLHAEALTCARSRLGGNERNVRF